STGTGPVNVPQNTGWMTHTANLAPFAGTTIRLQFREVIPQNFTGPGQFELDAVSLPTATPQDWYSYTLGAGESTTLALKALTGSGLNVELYDSSGALLQTGATGPTNFDRTLNYTAATAGTYFARVINTGTSNTTYSLLATRNAAFDTEPNSTSAAAQALG